MFVRLAKRTAVVGAALAAAGTMLAPAAASAQSYPYNYGTGYYGDRYDYGDRHRDSRSYDDYCRSDRGQRTASGALVGGALGAVAGSQMAARGRRTEGSVLGGVLGAVVGGAVGNDSGRRCANGYDYSRSSDYGYRGYDRYDDRYDNRYDYSRNDDRYDYGRDDDRYGYDRSYNDRYGCRTVESRTRDYSGRLVTRYEQVCDGY